MTQTEKRNKTAKIILNKLYEKALDKAYTVDDSLYKKSMDKLFDTTAWGFREMILVVVVASKLDSKFRASTNLYDCNPRALFETPIKEFLLENRIPHRKSGPLNVAKAAEGLNENWAAQRRPKEVADEVVKIVKLIENSSDKDIVDKIGISLLRKLVSEVKTLQNLCVEIDPTSDPDKLFCVCNELICKVPDSGNTPQKIAGLLLKNYHLGLHTGVVVAGGDDRASVTSTTSKKPGDLNEENPQGTILKVYEITVKPFDIARIRDSYDCIKKYAEDGGQEISEVIVVCRPEDCPNEMSCSSLNLYMGNYTYNDISYYYWNIKEWVSIMLQKMTPDSRKMFYIALNAYVSDFNTSAQVKLLWKELNESIIGS